MSRKRAAGIATMVALLLLATAVPAEGRHVRSGELDRSGYTTLQLLDLSGSHSGPVELAARRRQLSGRSSSTRRLGQVAGAPTRARTRRPVSGGTSRARKRAGRASGGTTKPRIRARNGSRGHTGARKRRAGRTPRRTTGARTRVRQVAGAPVAARAPVGDTSPEQSAQDPANGDDDTADAALVVAICAAAAAGLSLLVQVLSWLRARRRRVQVELKLVLPVDQRGEGEWAVFIEVANRTAEPIRWTSADLDLKDGRRLRFAEYPRGGELPAVVQPNESHRTWAACAVLERSGVDLRERMVATVETANGKVFHSKIRKLKKA